MKITEVLARVGITLESYTALRRHESVTFLPRRNKRESTFTFAEFIALKTFHTLRAHGMTIKIAAEAVEHAFPKIREFADKGTLGSMDEYIVSINMLALRGKILISHSWESLPQGARTIGRLQLDIRGIAALLNLAELKGGGSPPISS